MVKLIEAGNDGASLIQSSIDKMPSFSHDIQANSVLTKRILALKKKDGLKSDSKKIQKTEQI